MSGHGSSGRWHFPVNSLWSRCSHVHHLVRQPVSLVAASVFPCRLGKFCFRQCAFLLRTQRSFNHCFQFRRHLLQRLFRGFGQKSGLRRLMPRQFFPGRKKAFLFVQVPGRDDAASPRGAARKRGRGLLLAASEFPEGKGCFLGCQAPFEIHLEYQHLLCH